jgi:hypothetical protein
MIDAQQGTATVFERHFSPRTLAGMWGFSEDTIVRWFEDEPGVLKCGVDGARGRRRKITLRIPESVALRVYQERTR